MDKIEKQVSDLKWSSIEASLGSISPVEGGYSNAQRGLVTLPGNEPVFVKIGVDDNTNKWAKKEIATYNFLSSNHYPHIPRLLATNHSETAFALESLLTTDGWDWTNKWTTERLRSTLAAMDSLATLTPDKAYTKHLSLNMIDETKNTWLPFHEKPQSFRDLLSKLHKFGHSDIAAELDPEKLIAQNQLFRFKKDSLVHNDVRADNCAWNRHTGEVKLVDWNWTTLGNRSIDINALLVSADKSGIDIKKDFSDRLNTDALLWLAGFWLESSVQPMWPGASEKSSLRDYQLQSGATAYRLATGA